MPSHAPDLLIQGLADEPRAAVLFRLLAALEVSDRERPVPFGEGGRRNVLIQPPRHRNEPTASDRLIDAVWAMRCRRRPPRRFRIMSVSSVARVTPRGRAAPGAGRPMRAGRRRRARPRPVSSRLCARAARRPRSSDRPRRPLACARRWRCGVARPSDAVFEPFAQGEIARLEERRTAARALRIDADLTLSRYTDVMGELEALGARRPRHERLRAQLIARLDRCGRQPRSPTSARRVLLAGVRTLSTAPRLADHITGARSRVRSRARAARPAIPYG
jgi:Bacterial transcriptional activator domain